MLLVLQVTEVQSVLQAQTVSRLGRGRPEQRKYVRLSNEEIFQTSRLVREVNIEACTEENSYSVWDY